MIATWKVNVNGRGNGLRKTVKRGSSSSEIINNLLYKVCVCRTNGVTEGERERSIAGSASQSDVYVRVAVCLPLPMPV